MAPRIHERFYRPIESNQEDYLLIPCGTAILAVFSRAGSPCHFEICPLIDKAISEHLYPRFLCGQHRCGHFDGTMREGTPPCGKPSAEIFRQCSMVARPSWPCFHPAPAAGAEFTGWKPVPLIDCLNGQDHLQTLINDN